MLSTSAAVAAGAVVRVFRRDASNVENYHSLEDFFFSNLPAHFDSAANNEIDQNVQNHRETGFCSSNPMCEYKRRLALDHDASVLLCLINPSAKRRSTR